MSTITSPATDLKAKKIAFYADPNTKPRVAPPDFEAIPEELRREPRWALWQLVQRGGKWTKRPCQANGSGAKANDPSTWATFESVRRAYRRGGFEGIGIMLGGGLAGVDLDGVRDPDTGKFVRPANALGRRFATYAEVSPSGTGAKLIGRGVWRAGRHRKPFHDGEIEVYDDNRFFVITGDRIGDDGVVDIQAALDELAAQFTDAPSGANPQTPPDRPGTDDEWVDRALVVGGKFAKLWAGDTTGYTSRSEADLALCGLLAKLFGSDRAKVDAQFRRSGLMRDKWNELHGAKTYGELTVDKALEAADPAGAGDERPRILVDPHEHAVNDQAVAALARAPDVYQRGGFLVRVLEPAGGTRNQNDPPLICELPKDTVRELLSKHAHFWQSSEDGFKHLHPPTWCVSAVFARGHWPGVRRLEAVLPHPALLRDGTLLSTNGYDAGSGLLVRIPANLDVTVPDAPTGADVTTARKFLLDVVRDFPFKSPEHRAAWVAGLLTPLAWFAFDGPAPLFLIDKNVRGAGAGLMADTTALILTGRRFPVLSYTNDREELRKKITSLVVAGDRLALFDNLSGPVGNDVLDMALTGDRWKDRLLGGNRVFEGPLHVAWFGTGNNVQLKADTARRVCHIRMETQEERPELRTGFKYPDLRAHVRKNRGALLSAALTILRGWVAAGKPTHALPAWGSFEGWSSVVREAVVFADLPDPGETREQLQTTADRDAGAMTAILIGLARMDPRRRGVTAAEVVKLALALPYEPEDWQQGLRDAIEELGVGLEPSKLGYKFRHFAGRNFGGLMLTNVGAAHGSARWAAVPVGTGANHAPHAPHAPPTDPEGGDGGDGGHDSAQPDAALFDDDPRRPRDTGVERPRRT